MNERLRHFQALRLRYAYATIVSLFLFSSVIATGITISSSISLLLLLPLPLYFGQKTLRIHLKYRRSLAHSNLSTHFATPRFSLISFLTQPSFSFRLTLIILLLTIWTGLARSYTDQKNLQANQSLLTINH